MSFSSLLLCILLIGVEKRVDCDQTLHQKVKPENGNGIECLDPTDCRNYEPVSQQSKTQKQLDVYYNQKQQPMQTQFDCEQYCRTHQCKHDCLTYKSQSLQLNNCQNRLDCQNPADTDSNPRSRRHRTHLQQQHRYDPDVIALNALQVWNCDFGSNDCGIHNQHNMNSYFTLMPNTAQPVFGRTGLLYLDIASAHSSAARLITPYFPSNGCRYGCLTIEYILCGTGIENLYLIQQDVRNCCIWQKRNDHSYRWLKSSLTIDLSRTDPRFFIEVRFNRLKRYGFVGISDMRFNYGECDRNESNECDLNQFFGNLF